MLQTRFSYHFCVVVVWLHRFTSRNYLPLDHWDDYTLRKCTIRSIYSNIPLNPHWDFPPIYCIPLRGARRTELDFYGRLKWFARPARVWYLLRLVRIYDFYLGLPFYLLCDRIVVSLAPTVAWKRKLPQPIINYQDLYVCVCISMGRFTLSHTSPPNSITLWILNGRSRVEMAEWHDF